MPKREFQEQCWADECRLAVVVICHVYVYAIDINLQGATTTEGEN
jgi:hypothetical protein